MVHFPRRDSINICRTARRAKFISILMFPSNIGDAISGRCLWPNVQLPSMQRDSSRPRGPKKSSYLRMPPVTSFAGSSTVRSMTSYMTLNQTHDVTRWSWIESANHTACDFPLQNLPLGVFRTATQVPPRPGIAIGSSILDLAAIARSGLHHQGIPAAAPTAFAAA